MNICRNLNTCFLIGCSAHQQSATTLTANSFYEKVPKNSTLPDNANCQWNITAPAGKVVRIWLNVTEFDRPCNEEYLRIYDGPSTSSNIIVQYCNEESSLIDSEHYYYSTGRRMFLVVKTGSNSSAQMSVYYQATDFQGKFYRRRHIKVIPSNDAKQVT